MAAGHIETRWKKPKKPGGKPIPVYRVVVPRSPERGSKPLIRHFDRKKEAEAALDEMRDWVRLGFIPDTKLTVSGLLDRWLAEHVDVKCKPKTAYTHKSIVKKHLKPRLGSVKALSLRPAAIGQTWADMRKAEFSDSVIEHCYDVLRAALQWAVGIELLLRNPAAVNAATPPVVKYGKRPTISAAQMKGLVLAAEQDPQLSMAIMLATATGARRAELMALQPGDVDLKGKRIHIWRSQCWVPKHRGALQPTKTGRERWVALPPFAMAVLTPMLKDRIFGPDEYLIAERDPDEIGKRFRALVDSLKLPEGLRLHDLRHSYATARLEAGEDIKTLQEALGHTRATTTLDIYAHVTEAMRKAGDERVEKVFEVEAEHLGNTSETKALPLKQ